MNYCIQRVNADPALTKITFRRKVTMAEIDSTVQKPLVYDLLSRLNASFARVHRNMAALEQVGIFDPLIMQVLGRQSEQVRANVNFHLLGTMRGIEERDRERFTEISD